MPKLSLIPKSQAHPITIEEALAAFDRDLRGSSAGQSIPTGFEYLDRMIDGIHRGQLTVLAARPGVGKSTFASRVIGTAAALGRGPVLIFTLGMSRSQLAMRLLCMEANVSSYDLQNARLSPEQLERVETAKGSIARLNLFIDDTPALSIHEVVERIHAFRARNADACLIAVENIQDVVAGVTSPTRGGGSGAVAQVLKDEAIALDLPVLATVSLKRSLEQRRDKRPRLPDFYSVDIARAADVLLVLYAEELYDPDTADKGQAEISILRNRRGAPGIVRLVRDPACFSFRSFDYGDAWHL